MKKIAFRSIRSIDDFIDYCRQPNTKWTVKFIKQSNPLEIEILFIHYNTPLAFITASGTLYYLREYTKRYFISTMTCWFLSHLKWLQDSLHCEDEMIGLSYKTFAGAIKQSIYDTHIHQMGWLIIPEVE